MRFNEFKIIREAFVVSEPTSRHGVEVADVQKALMALGYPLPIHGVDGIRGPETIGAVKQFQADAGVTVDGDPGPETTAALNQALAKNPDIASKLVHSTSAEVKPMQASAGTRSVNPQSKVKNAVSSNEVAQYLSSKGLDRNQVLGIMSNISAESGFDSGAIGDNGTSGGLFQHHADRFANMVDAAGGDDNWQKNWQKQIDFALSEPAGSKYAKMSFKSPEQATEWWTRYFEIPADVNQQVASRINGLNRFA
jgi:hypothetical protein